MPPPRWPAILYCLLSWAGAFYHLILFSFLKRDVRDALFLSELALGWIDGLTFAAAAAGGLALGRAADKGRQRIVLALAPALPALGSWILASAASAPAVFFARIVVGLGVGGGWGVGHAVIASIYEGRARLRAAAILQTGGPIGVIAAALVGCVLIPSGPDGWRTVLAWSAVTAAIAALDPWAMRSARTESGPPALAGSTRIATDRPTSSRPGVPNLRTQVGVALKPARGSPTSAAGWGTGAVQAWTRPALRIFSLLVLQMAAYWCTFGWLPSHLIGLGVARRNVGWIQLSTGAAQALADLGFGWLSPKAGLRRLFAICNVAFGCGVLALAVAFDSVAASPLALTATICAVGLGSGSWAAFGPLYAAHVPAAVRSSVSSFSYHLARATQLVVQPAVAALATAAASGGSHATTLVVGAVAAFCGAVAVRGLPRAAAS